MPFVRYNRDKRGYESTLVLHAYRSPQGVQQNRVLYLFRSPANLQVGRRPLDEEVVTALEHMHPDLTFDWPALLREQAQPRYETRPKSRRPSQPRGGRSGGRRPESPPPPPTEVVVDDQSLLGRVLGAAEAARLRHRYQELRQRIARRARTPEDRDRLSERAERLNPDDWPDEAGVRAAAATVEADIDAVAGELPSRRRGRRGGRNRSAEGGTVAPGTADASGIMDSGEGGESNAADDQPVAPDRNPDAAGHSGGVGPDPSAAGPDADDVPAEV